MPPGPSAPLNEVRLLLFARARELAGTDALVLRLPPRASVAAALEAARRAAPQLADYIAHCRVAVNHAFEELDAEVPPGAELALIPPVSGGSRDGVAVCGSAP